MSRLRAVFISCRFHDDDRSVVEWVDRKLKSFALSTHIANAPTGDPPPEKVLADIAARDILVAVVTRVASPWIQNEIGIAYALGKPIIGFFEKGVLDKGLYPYIADYLEFSREDLENSTDGVIHLINSVLRKIDAGQPLPQTEPHSVRLIGQRELADRLPAEIARSKSLDLLAYTAETFLNWGCHEALCRNLDLKARVLIRDPASDPRKSPMAQASLNFIHNLAHPGVEVRLYKEAPLLRAIIFDQTRGYVCMYRWDPQTHFEFIGAENNALAFVAKDGVFGALWLDLYASRFAYEWQRNSPAV